MALTFTVETGAGVASSNSYASEANAITYHDGHLYAASWDSAASLKRQEGLVMATRLLDELVDWNGSKVDRTNSLRWPRHNVRDRDGWAIDGNAIPQELIDATCEFARLLIDEDRTAEDDTKGFSAIKAGSIALDIDKFDRKQVIPDHVAEMIGHMGNVRGAGSMTVSLARA